MVWLLPTTLTLKYLAESEVKADADTLKRRPKWLQNYHNDPKFLDRYVNWSNSADPDQEQSDQGLHCLQFRLYLLDVFL